MNAMIVTSAGDLDWRRVPDPIAGPGDAIVAVRATALNRADLAQRSGNYPPPAGESDVLGLELAGTLTHVPAGDHDFAVGDPVCALVAGGGYAELARVPLGMLMRLPRGWSFVEAAAMPEVYSTAYLNLVLEAELRARERVVIHGGASGVGTAAIQVAKAWGCDVAATAGSAEKTAICLAQGADVAIDYTKQDFAEEIGAVFEGGVDVVLDMVGAEYFGRNLDLLRVGGRLVIIATLSGAKATIDLRELMARRARIVGSTLRNRPLEEKVSLRDALVRDLFPRFEEGTMAPVIDAVVPIGDAEDAHARMRANENAGKIVLVVAPGSDERP